MQTFCVPALRANHACDASRHLRATGYGEAACHQSLGEPASPRGVTIADLDEDDIQLTVDNAVALGRLERLKRRTTKAVLTGLGVIVEGKLINAAVALYGRTQQLQSLYPQCASASPGSAARTGWATSAITGSIGGTPSPWGMHGAHYEYYHDDGCECYVLEVWPVAFEDPQPEGGYRQDTENVVCYEFAEFEFSETIKLVSLEHLHFSQRREIFEIGWNEMGQDLELRVHLVPQEIDDS